MSKCLVSQVDIVEGLPPRFTRKKRKLHFGYLIG